MSDRERLGPRLELISEGRTVRTISLNGGVVQIGRAIGLDLRFDDTRVSRWHARIERQGDGSFYLVDTSTHRATYLNDLRIEPSRPVPLCDGDLIRVADHELIFRGSEQILADDTDSSSTVLGTLADLSSQHLSRSSPRPAHTLQAVLDVIRVLRGGDLDELLGHALERLMELLPQTESCLIVTTDLDGQLPIRAARRRGGLPLNPTLSRSILDRVLTRGEALLIQNVAMDTRFAGQESVHGLFRAAMCVPLIGHDGRPMGMVQLCGEADRFTNADLELLAALAWPLAMTVENQTLLRERTAWAAAREIQQAMLPRDRPVVPGYTFWECYLPALEVSGDLYDYIRVDRDGVGDDPRWVVCVGDVAGKGMPAALFSAAISPEVRHAVWNGAPPAEVLRRVNRYVCECGFDHRFVTMVLGELDPRTNRLTLANAGHEWPILCRTDGTIEHLDLPGSGPPLGVSPDNVYESFTIALQPGEVVVLHTDGLGDAIDGDHERFGLEGIVRVLKNAPRDVCLAGGALFEAVNEHSRGRMPFDDLTIVCFGRDFDGHESGKKTMDFAQVED